MDQLFRYVGIADDLTARPKPERPKRLTGAPRVHIAVLHLTFNSEEPAMPESEARAAVVPGRRSCLDVMTEHMF